jgi:hypothetical protein
VQRRDFLATVAVITIGGWAPSAMSFQTPPDFSGRWTIETPAPPAPAPPAAGGAAPALRPDQGALGRGDMGSGWGSPLTITQDAKQLVVEQTLFSRYDFATQPRSAYALDGSESRNDVMIGHSTQVRTSRARWDGQSLIITTTYPGSDPSSGKPFTTDVTHRLTLELPTMLVVEVTRGAALGGKPTTAKTVYRKG